MHLFTLLPLFLSLAACSTIPVDKRASGSQRMRTIETAPGVTQQVTEDEKWALVKEHSHFIDITDLSTVDYKILDNTPVFRAVYPAQMKQQTAVKALLPSINKSNMQTNLKTLSDFHTRFYNTTWGVQSSAWLLSTVQKVIKDAGADKNGVVATPFNHSWPQSSIIARIPGKSAKVVVVGGHQDSINGDAPETGRAPGADDNGSGVITILESLRVLLSDPTIAQGKAENTIEFHWYSAEEVGLMGSADIFNSYRTKNVDVRSMLNQDMTGVIDKTKPERFGLVTDNVDGNLTSFVQNVISTYCAIPVAATQCGYACSDHASAARAGYQSAFVFESTMDAHNVGIHTENDTMDRVSFDHMAEHAKLIIGYTYELGMTAGL